MGLLDEHLLTSTCKNLHLAVKFREKEIFGEPKGIGLDCGAASTVMRGQPASKTGHPLCLAQQNL
jgi:hypothetical protein